MFFFREGLSIGLRELFGLWGESRDFGWRVFVIVVFLVFRWLVGSRVLYFFWVGFCRRSVVLC